MSTRVDTALLIIRMVVGTVYFMHGWQKVFMIGIGGVAGFFGNLGIPAPQVAAPFLSILELVGGTALVVGLLTRWVALLLAIDALVAIWLVHLPAGFFVSPNAFGAEFVLVLLVNLVALALAGPGAFAIDRLIGRRTPGPAPAEPPADTM